MWGSASRRREGLWLLLLGTRTFQAAWLTGRKTAGAQTQPDTHTRGRTGGPLSAYCVQGWGGRSAKGTRPRPAGAIRAAGLPADCRCWERCHHRATAGLLPRGTAVASLGATPSSSGQGSCLPGEGGPVQATERRRPGPGRDSVWEGCGLVTQEMPGWLVSTSPSGFTGYSRETAKGQVLDTGLGRSLGLRQLECWQEW